MKNEVNKKCNICGILCCGLICSCTSTTKSRKLNSVRLEIKGSTSNTKKGINNFTAISSSIINNTCPQITSHSNNSKFDLFIHPDNSLTTYTKPNLLIFINPIGGQGYSLKIWNTVKPIFHASYLNYHVIHTNKNKHAYEYLMQISSYELNQYTGVICVSGDGIIHEVVNAFMKRKIKNIKIGAIPAGSFNALTKCITERANEESNAMACAYLICKGNSLKIDIMEYDFLDKDNFVDKEGKENSDEKLIVENSNENMNENIENFETEITPLEKCSVIYGFESLTWTIIADIDLDSDPLRCFRIY